MHDHNKVGFCEKMRKEDSLSAIFIRSFRAQHFTVSPTIALPLVISTCNPLGIVPPQWGNQFQRQNRESILESEIDTRIEIARLRVARYSAQMDESTLLQNQGSRDTRACVLNC